MIVFIMTIIMYPQTQQQQQQQQHTTLPGPSVTHVPVLYIEESVKSTRPDITGKYDTDWRIYIIYRYGKYLFMGTRQPIPTTTSETNTLNSRKHKNKNRVRRSEKKKNLSWPVVSMSFNYPSELYEYMLSLFGTSKANVTLYISTAKTSAYMDEIFINPSHSNMQHMDEERVNRKMELVGYDRVRVPAEYFCDKYKQNIVKQMLLNLDCMCHAPIGMTLSFRCFVDPSSSMMASNDAVDSTDPIDNRIHPDPGSEGEGAYDYEYDCYD